jgi:hypothetical protein
MGFESGRTSSLDGTRGISIAIGWSLKISCERGGGDQLSLAYLLDLNKPLRPRASRAWNQSHAQ